MELGLQGRVSIVTGGSRGIGKSVAESLAHEGAHVVICAREAGYLNSVEREILLLGESALSVTADVTKPADVKRVVDTTIEKFGSLDILVNNVGGTTRFGAFSELTHDDWMRSFELNVMTMVYFVQYALPFLVQSQSPRIINISSISGVEPGFYNPHYTITKAATINLSKYLANWLAKDQILVNAVCPGPVYSESWNRNVQCLAERDNLTLEEAGEIMNNQESLKIPLQRIGNGEDVAGLVVFLASEKAKWITGSCFHVNGGKLRSVC
ncbi:MAG: glucose 1-dehydrogenase [Chloroflexota bacterium]|nr:glucose 1-dehydrogenase [Chloroflexota bacterium]